MNLLRAAYWVLLASARNRLLRQVKRLREPKYLVATALGGLYFWSIFLRRMASLGRGGHPPEIWLPVIELVLGALALLALAASWLFGGEDGALRFTEAEVQFFFPAPVSRAGLIRYKLARTAVLTGFSALLLTLLMGLRLTAHGGCFALGAWVGMTTLSLHTSAASLARATLADHGLRGLRRQVLTAVILLAGGAVLVYAFLDTPTLAVPDVESAKDLHAWALALLHTPPLSVLLFPVRASLEVALAPTRLDALAALPAALGVLAVHYLWLVRSHFAFEEASVEAAQRVAARVQALRSGRGQLMVRQIRPPFALLARGRPEVALLWKNVVGIVRAYAIRGTLIALYLAASSAAVAWAALHTRSDVRWALGTALTLALAGYLTLLGPIVVRCDFREDLAHVDLLRAWPMSGRQVVVGELLAPILVLGVGELILLGLAALCSVGVELPGVPVGARLAIIGAAAVILPAITLCTLVLQNGAALLFPAWVSAGRRVRGIEALGQRLLTLTANLLALVGALLPATLVGAAVAVPGWWLLAWGGVPLAALACAAVLVAEAHVATGWLGRTFERFDLTL